MISRSSNPECHAVLASLSERYPPLEGRSPTRYSPVRHSTQDRSPFRVRLACVRHAASVDSEPGSNSQVKVIVLRRALRLVVGHLLNQRRLLALLFVTSCDDSHRPLLALRPCESAVTLTGWFPPSLSLSLEQQRTCVHVLSSFQRTEVMRCFRPFPSVALATTLFRGTFQSYPADFGFVNKIIAIDDEYFCVEVRRPCREYLRRRVERSRSLRPETTCRTGESYNQVSGLSTPSS